MQEAPGMTFPVLRQLLRCAFGHDASSSFAPLGPEIDNPIGALDDIQIVFDHHQSIPRRSQLVEDLEKLCYVMKMKPGGRLIQQVEGVSPKTGGSTRWPA